VRFVDECRVKVVAGNGGDGAVAFRREKFIPFGGPSGGDGGRGGDVVLEGDEGLSTLLDLTYARAIEAQRGQHGMGKDCHGRGGEDRIVRVPVGTQVFDAETGELVFDITAHGERFVVVKGGKGGRGNIHFASPHDRAPRRAEKGFPGETRELRLELKVLADVGLLGFPNVGKSTFVSAVSAARPKVADYPFTTLTPSLGVVAIGGGAHAGGTHFVIADIPGLIPGASEGIGLGIRFLKHVERTRALLHLVTLDAAEGRDPLADYRALRNELEQFSPELARRPEVVALSKADLPEVREAHAELEKRFARENVKLWLVSAATRAGLDPLLDELWRFVRKARDGAPSDDADETRPRAQRAPRPTPEAKSKQRPTAKSKPAAKAKAKATSKPRPKPKPTSKPRPKPNATPKRAVKSKTAKSKTPTKPNATPKPKSKPSAKPRPQAAAASRAKARPKAKAKAAPGRRAPSRRR
jgi:GTP-binding protein